MDKTNSGVVWLSDPTDKMSSGPVWLFDPMDKNSGVVWLSSPNAKINSGVVWLSNPIIKTNQVSSEFIMGNKLRKKTTVSNSLGEHSSYYS